VAELRSHRSSRVSREIVLRAFDMASRISTSPTLGPPYGYQPRKRSATSWPPTSPRIATSWSSRPRRLGHVAWSLWRPAGHANTCSPASTRACSGWVSIMSDIFYSHPLRPRTALEETMGALPRRFARARRSTPASLLFERPDQGAAGMLPVHGHTRYSSTSPRNNMLNRWNRGRRPARRARSRGGGLHRLLAARTGVTHREISQWHSRWFARDALALPVADQITQDTSRRCSSKCDRSTKGQPLAQMAWAWTLRDPRVTSAVIE